MFPKFYEKESELPAEVVQNLQGIPIQDKVNYIMQWLSIKSRVKNKYMLFMIMYDIQDNKIRTHIAKYLIRKGCMRIQKSIYLAKGSKKLMHQISETLGEINEAYENEDSIFVLPIPQEKFNNMKVIGKNIAFEIVTEPKSVYIF